MRSGNNEANTRLNLTAGTASVTVALVLVALKLWALAETGALSVAASLTDSALDLIMSLGALMAVFYAARPPDDDHRFGHSSAEDLAALGQSVFILISAGVIGWSGIRRLLDETPPALSAEGRGIAVMLLSIALTILLLLWQRRVVAQTGNRVVQADALHYLGDLVPGVGAILSLWVSARFGYVQLDSVVAMGTAAMLIVAASRIGKAAWDALMDRAPDPVLIGSIEAIASGWPGVHGHHDLKMRRAGSRVFVNLHVELDGRLSLDEAHAIGAALRRAILKTHPETDVIIHKDPVGVRPHPDDPSRKRATS